MNNIQLGNSIYVDAHVHIYDCFDLDELFESAHANLKKVAEECSPNSRFTGILLLTETCAQNKFSDLKDLALQAKADITRSQSKWGIYEIPDDNAALFVKRTSGECLLIVAGRQVVTKEGLEVLALLTSAKFDDGLPLDVIVAKIVSENGLPVLPWGVGKWFGRRGKLILDYLGNNKNGHIMLGDNGGRPIFWKKPPQFRQAYTLGIAILPGSDPLPIASEEKRIGSFGFILQGDISLSNPVRDLKQLLIKPNLNIETFGKLQGPMRFLYNQLHIRISKRS